MNAYNPGCFAAGSWLQNANNDLFISHVYKMTNVFFLAFSFSSQLCDSQYNETPWRAGLNVNHVFGVALQRTWSIFVFTGESVHVCTAGKLLPVLPPSLHRFASAPTTFLIADYNGTCEPTAYKNRRICISEGAARVDGSRSVTGSTGTSVSTRSSVSTTCSDSGDDDSAGITTTGLMCSDRADARRKLGGFCKKHNFNHYISLNFFFLLPGREVSLKSYLNV